jgi:hypothetical protein
MPGLNDQGEVVFPAEVADATGKRLGIGTFYRGLDGSLQAVALPHPLGSGGPHLDNAFFATINNSGRVALRGRGYGQNRPSAYVWEKGTLTPLVQAGSETPEGARIVEVAGAWVNNQNRNVLVEVLLNREEIGAHALYLRTEEKLIPVAIPGQPMPGGGQFASMQHYQHRRGDAADAFGVSYPNALGQHAFYCLIREEGRTKTAAYRMGTDGSLSLITKTGAATEVGQVTRVGDLNQLGWGYGIALNSKGQVAMGLQVAGSTRPVLTLWSPAP